MENRDFELVPQTPAEESKAKKKAFWKNVGLIFLAFGLAILTVVVINLGR